MKYLGVLGLAVTMAACGTFVEAIPLNSPPRVLQPRAPGSVEVYSSSPPTRPHVDVALLRADQTNHSSANTLKMVQELQLKAAQLGCDAIHVSGIAERAGAPPGEALALIDPGSHIMTATCMVYLSSTPALVVAPAVTPAAPAATPAVTPATPTVNLGHSAPPATEAARSRSVQTR